MCWNIPSSFAEKYFILLSWYIYIFSEITSCQTCVSLFLHLIPCLIICFDIINYLIFCFNFISTANDFFFRFQQKFTVTAKYPQFLFQVKVFLPFVPVISVTTPKPSSFEIEWNRFRACSAQRLIFFKCKISQKKVTVEAKIEEK